MSNRRVRHKITSDSADYTKGYSDGMRAAFEESELDAYYAGVGYGKYQSGDKHIGFNNAEERAQFEKGIRKKDDHFNAYRVRKLSFWERLFGVKTTRRKSIDTRNRRKEVTKKVKRTSRARRKNTKGRRKNGKKR